MPKSLKLINDFSGGLVDAYHSRDIPENSLSKSVNVQLTQNGSIELIASPETKINLSGDFFFDSINTFDYLQGHQIFHFKSDFALSQKVKVLSLKQRLFKVIVSPSGFVNLTVKLSQTQILFSFSVMVQTSLILVTYESIII